MPSDLDFAGPLREALLGRRLHLRPGRRGDRRGGAPGARAQRDPPRLRRTTSASPLDTLVRLFLLQAPVARDDAERALPGLVEPALQRRPAGAERQRGRGPDRLPALRRRGRTVTSGSSPT